MEECLLPNIFEISYLPHCKPFYTSDFLLRKISHFCCCFQIFLSFILFLHFQAFISHSTHPFPPFNIQNICAKIKSITLHCCPSPNIVEILHSSVFLKIIRINNLHQESKTSNRIRKNF